MLVYACSIMLLEGAAAWAFKTLCVKVLAALFSEAVDYHTLAKFEQQYEALPDKRRRPGPKLRKVHRARQPQWQPHAVA